MAKASPGTPDTVEGREPIVQAGNEGRVPSACTVKFRPSAANVEEPIRCDREAHTSEAPVYSPQPKTDDAATGHALSRRGQRTKAVWPVVRPSEANVDVHVAKITV